MSATVDLVGENSEAKYSQILASSPCKCKYFWCNGIPLSSTDSGRDPKIGLDHTSRSQSIRAQSLDTSVAFLSRYLLKLMMDITIVGEIHHGIVGYFVVCLETSASLTPY